MMLAPFRPAQGRAFGCPFTGLLGVLFVMIVVSACGDGPSVDTAEVPSGTAIGERAPALSGTEAEGREYELAPEGSPTFVVFFRGYGCGLCRERLRELQTNLGEYRRLGARVVAVSADEAENLERARRELELDFPVVGVDDSTLAAWGLVGDATPPLPGSYLIDRDGLIVFRHVGRNASDRAHDLEVLAALQALRER
jgi:peroxiredoxin